LRNYKQNEKLIRKVLKQCYDLYQLTTSSKDGMYLLKLFKMVEKHSILRKFAEKELGGDFSHFLLSQKKGDKFTQNFINITGRALDVAGLNNEAT
jgi:hypothetical protein